MAIKKNLIIDQGTTYSANIDLLDAGGEPMDVTGYTSRSQFRKHYTSTNSVSFTTSLSTGKLTLSLASNATVNVAAGRYVYDAEIVDASNNVTRVVEGIITITPEVTR